MCDRNILKPGASIKPEIALSHVRDLIEKQYGVRCESIHELNGYDDKNYKFVAHDGRVYVAKILNSLDSMNLEMVEAQNALLLYLRGKGVRCPEPIKNLQGGYYSLERLVSGDHVVRLMVFLPGLILHQVPYTKELFHDAGEFIARLDNTLENFDHKAYDTHQSLWMLDAIPNLKQFLYVIDDETKRHRIEAIINEFEVKVLQQKHLLPAGFIHGDFNEQNVVVERDADSKWYVAGILDFGDAQKGCYLYELAIAMTYMMIVSEQVDISGHLLNGYRAHRSISELELKLLPICIKARLCQSLVLGTYSSRQDAANQRYLLTTQKPGWKVLNELIERSDDEIIHAWINVHDE